MRKLVYQFDKLKLFHYSSKKKKKNIPPLLIVFSTINKTDLLDLMPSLSFIQSLLNQGIDIYLIEWGYPDSNDYKLSLSDYVSSYIYSCVRQIQKESSHKKINLLGICQGGVMAICYAALYEHIQQLILISTPIDFHTKDNTIGSLIKNVEMDGLVKGKCNLPGVYLKQFFRQLRPFELMVQSKRKSKKFLAVEKWLNDSPDQAGAAFGQFVQDLYQENKLVKGKFILNKKRINLAKIKIPVFNIMASDDVIVPKSASLALKKHIHPKYYTEHIVDGGHIGIYINKETLKMLPKLILKTLSS